MSIISDGFAPNGVRIIVKDDYIAKTPEGGMESNHFSKAFAMRSSSRIMIQFCS